MKLSVRLFLGYFFLVAVAGWLALMLVVRQISPGVRAVLEASLVDTANLLAELAAPDLLQDRIADGTFAQAIERYTARPVAAAIFAYPKRSLDYRVYVTDAAGIVRFDSAGKAIGQDYSRWNDVYLTLHGQYGARATLANPDDKTSTVMHVAAPVRDGNKLIGVVTVTYPVALLQPIIEASKTMILNGSFWLFGSALAFGAVFTWRLTRAIDLLVGYAQAVTTGRKTSLPRFRSLELATLAQALEIMRQKLEGKQYVEHYVQTLTHEMKSPLAAIRGAAELLDEPLPDAERRRFAGNAREQAERLDQLIERMLGLAALEQRQQLAEPSAIEINRLLQNVLLEKTPQLTQQKLATCTTFCAECQVWGESFLLQQALSNLLDNAISFSPSGSIIEISTAQRNGKLQISIRDHGPGIPDYALERVFERFYSLPRPDNGKKSTGLGLAFVREVALLHQGGVTVSNADTGGVEAILTLQALN